MIGHLPLVQAWQTLLVAGMQRHLSMLFMMIVIVFGLMYHLHLWILPLSLIRFDLRLALHEACVPADYGHLTAVH